MKASKRVLLNKSMLNLSKLSCYYPYFLAVCKII